MKGEIIMATLTAKTTMHSATSYTDMNKKGLWTRFRNYLAENQQTIIAGLALLNGTSYYTYCRSLNK